MEEKKQVTREKLIDIIAKAMRDESKSMGDKTNVIFPIKYENWYSGCGNNSKWHSSRITLFGAKTKKVKELIGTPRCIEIERTEIVDMVYTFTDKEITHKQFIDILNLALAKARVRGRVVYKEWEDCTGYRYTTQYYFKRVELFSKPCKEFNSLYNYVEKYGKFTIGDLDVYQVNICGKRSSYSDSGRYYYLCYDAKMCKAILDAIRKFKGSKDILKVSTKEYVDHGDEGDYRCAQYQESEWYGHRGNKLCVEVTTPTGKLKLNKEFYW